MLHFCFTTVIWHKPQISLIWSGTCGRHEWSSWPGSELPAISGLTGSWLIALHLCKYERGMITDNSCSVHISVVTFSSLSLPWNLPFSFSHLFPSTLPLPHESCYYCNASTYVLYFLQHCKQSIKLGVALSECGYNECWMNAMLMLSRWTLLSWHCSGSGRLCNLVYHKKVVHTSSDCTALLVGQLAQW